MRPSFAAGLAITFALALSSPAVPDPVTVVSQGAVTEANATRFVLHSDRLGRNFEVVVQSPRPTVFLPGQKFPAIYALDGGYGLAGPLGLFLSGRDVMAPAIIVSVDYLPGQAALRATDLAHHPFTIGGETLGGGGAAFEAFLLQDLKPYIEARYPADPAGSILFGHSMGAVFAANVFADKPDAFDGYILASFVEPRDPTAAGRVRKAARLAHGQRVFLAVGGDEDGTTAEKRRMRQGFSDLAAAFRSSPNVALNARVYAGENHLSYYPSLIIDAFRFVLPPTVPVNLPFTALPEATIARYVGVYALPDGRKITVKAARDSMLTAQVADGPAVYLLPNGTDRYYAYTSDLDVRFDNAGMTLAGRGTAEVKAQRESPR